MSRPIENVAVLNSLLRTLLGFTIVAGLGALSYWGYRTLTADDRLEEEFQSKLAQKDKALVDAEKQLTDAQAAISERERELKQKQGQLDSQREQIDAQNDQINELTVRNDELSNENRELSQENEKLATSLRLLTVNHRLAQVTVLDVTTDPDTGKKTSTIEFVELSPAGNPIEDKPRIFEIPGEVFYIDTWLVKFEDKFIKEADLERGTSLCLFRRIFGENQEPVHGFELDPSGSQPNTYARGGKISDLEKEIWSNFWEIANDPARTQGLGIRSIHGEAVSKKAVPGKRYIIELRASAGLDFVTTSDAGQAEPVY